MIYRNCYCPYCNSKLNFNINTFYISQRINCTKCDKDFLILNNSKVVPLTDEQRQSLLDGDTLYKRTLRRKNKPLE